MELKGLIFKSAQKPKEDKAGTSQVASRPVVPASRPPVEVSYLGPKNAVPMATISARKNVSEQPDQQFDKQLRDSLQAVPQQGYLELIDQLEILSDAIKDPVARMRTALKSIERAHGITSDQIAASLRGSSDMLVQEEKNFSEAIEAQARERVATSQDSIKQLDAQIQAIEAELQRLQSEQARLKSERQQIQEQIGSVEGLRRQVEERFASAFTYHQKRLDDIRAQLETLGVSKK